MKKAYQKVFLVGINLSFLLYIIVLFGIGGYAPQYLSIMKNILKLYVSILLISIYNPITYKKREFSEFDRKLVFSAGIFLLLSTTLISGIEEYIKQKLVFYRNKILMFN